MSDSNPLIGVNVLQVSLAGDVLYTVVVPKALDCAEVTAKCKAIAKRLRDNASPVDRYHRTGFFEAFQREVRELGCEVVHPYLCAIER